MKPMNKFNLEFGFLEIVEQLKKLQLDKPSACCGIFLTVLLIFRLSSWNVFGSVAHLLKAIRCWRNMDGFCENSL